MVKRGHWNGEDDDGFERFRRRQALLQRCALSYLIPERTLNENFWENFFRRAVREEVERIVLHPSPRPALTQAGTSGVRSLQLQFVEKLPSTVFTGGNIKAEDGNPIQIELIDASSRTRVNSGPLSSIKVELVVLKGDFRFEDDEDWTEQEFNDSIQREREGRRPLVTRVLTVTLREGAGHFGEIVFTDNSSWTRNGMFRLGARVVKTHCGERIKEARSEPFRVKDHRGEANQKHPHPHLDDDVWRLKKIRKDGAHHKRLVAAGIRTVKDFLRTYAINPSKVCSCFEKRVTEKLLGTIIQHAKTCVIDDGELYSYQRAGDDVALQFNAIYQVVAATFDGCNYRPVKNLTSAEKDVVEVLKRQAYEHVNDWIPVNEQSTVSLSRPSASLSDQPFCVPEQSLEQIYFPVAHQDQQETLLSFNHPSFLASQIDAPGTSRQFEASVAQNSHPMIPSNSFLMDELLPVLSSNFMTEYDNSLVQTPYLTAPWGQENGFLFASDVGVRTGKPKAAWCKIRAAVKWRSVRRGLAAKRMARPIFYC